MSSMSVGKAGALRHNSGNMSENRKKGGADAGRKGGRRYIDKG
jgi:hypothetical protein